MSTISVNKTKEDWKFSVETGTTSGTTFHTVTIDEKYWQDLTNGEVEPEELIKKSFEFLLERESATSILKEFNLSVIEKYFPEYPDKIKEYL